MPSPSLDSSLIVSLLLPMGVEIDGKGRALRWVLSNHADEDAGINESRALACELVAWQFLTFLSESDLIDALLYELPMTLADDSVPGSARRASPDLRTIDGSVDERTSLLRCRGSEHSHRGPPERTTISSPTELGSNLESQGHSHDALTQSLAGNNALEIAAIANAKKFMSQKPVQKIVNDIWSGDIIFWETLSTHAVKKPRPYNKRVADPYTRLRVPKYQKYFQIVFFLLFLALYYVVLVERNPRHVTVAEIFLYVWIFAFAYDEYGELFDAGYLFYRLDFWSLWDIGIIGIGAAFLITRK